MPIDAKRTRTLRAAAGVAALLLAVAACGGGDAHRGAAGDSGSLTATTERRATIAGFTRDTLSAAARIVALYPGQGADSAVIAFTFADSTRGVGAGLGVLDLRAPDGARQARLAWPDSVSAAWWSAPHVLSFATATGRGVTAKVDVNADTLAVVIDSGGGGGATAAAAAASPTAPPPVPVAARARATVFVDSAHLQPAGGAAPHAALRYAVDSLIAAPSGRLVALYVTAADASGRHVNPAWYALALPSGAVASIDSVVGPVNELPATTGAWGGADGTTFYYARGKGVYGARVK